MRQLRLGRRLARSCAASAGTRCVVFGGVIEQDVPGAETVALSGDPARARDDLVDAGTRLSV